MVAAEQVFQWDGECWLAFSQVLLGKKFFLIPYSLGHPYNKAHYTR